MSKLTSEIKRLEQEIAYNRQTATLQFQHMKNSIADKITSAQKSPLLYLPLFVIGSFIVKKFKRRTKLHTRKLKHPRESLSLLQKIMALSSEISIAIKIFNRVKPILAKLTQKTNPRATIAH